MKTKHLQAPLLPQEKSRLALLTLIQTGLWTLTSVMVLVIAVRQSAIANRQPTMVQLVNGQTFFVAEKDRLFRYPSVIQKFVSDWTTLTFNWDDKIPGTNEPDKGIPAGSGRVPTTTWFASLLMESNFAKASLKKIAELVPNTLFSGQLRSTTVISYLSEPRQVAPGTWQIDMVATRILIDRTTGRDDRIPFNRTFTVHAVEIPKSPLGSTASLVEQKIYEVRSTGLEITKIVEFTPPL